MAKTRKKQHIDQDVYSAALERIRYLYNRFDQVVVSFSGGKDSTAVLNLTIEVAREIGRLPVRAVFVDEEAIHPTTIEYVERVRLNPDVQLDWYCLPVKHRNACSNEEPFWYCWDPAKRELWCRPMPEGAITSCQHFRPGDQFQDWMPRIFPKDDGNVALLTGIRTQESMRRYRIIAQKKNDVYITGADQGNCFRCFPVYDWSSEDVWKLIEQKGYDYNRTYDVFNLTDLHNRLLTQRVCPPYGEEPLRGLWVYAECWPELWHKMLYRVPGVATAWRYSNTELYSNHSKPEHLTWRQALDVVLESYSEPEYRNQVTSNINKLVRMHLTKTPDVVPDEQPHPLSGVSWKFLYKIAVKGDFKGRQAGMAANEGGKILAKQGMTLSEARARYGRTG